MSSSDNPGYAEFASALFAYRRSCCPALPGREGMYTFLNGVLALLFPHFSTAALGSSEEIAQRLSALQRGLEDLLQPLSAQLEVSVEKISGTFFKEKLPLVHQSLLLDAEALYQGDPAAESVDEVIMTYPGFLAIAVYRIAHEFYDLGVPLFPRFLSEWAHEHSGIDIHPGARIGRSFFIDHGTGVVIGETTEIGNEVKIYQGVTLGALSVDKSLADKKRHPTIEDRTVIYSNATILGGSTVVGHDSVIGGNVWLTESVPPFSTVYHKSEIKVRSSAESA